jgi:hypothetical protein
MNPERGFLAFVSPSVFFAADFYSMNVMGKDKCQHLKVQ